MKAARFLRIAVILELVMIPVAVAISFFTDSLLPPEVLALEENQQGILTDFSEFSIELVLWGSFGLIMFGVWIASIVGLLKLQHWGAWLYLVSVLLSLPRYLVMGFDVQHPLDIIMTDLYRYIPGFIIGLAFFSDAIPKTKANKSQ